MFTSIVSAIIVMGGLGLLFAVVLALASRIFSVQRDARIIELESVLPGTNCGVCGAAGCSGYAEGVVEGRYPANRCVVGGNEVVEKIAQIMHTDVIEIIPKVAVVRCQGDKDKSAEQAVYQGIADCQAAILINEGGKGCVYGCFGFGNCERSCPFDAIVMTEKGLPIVDDFLCTGCGECVKACPRGIMEVIPKDQIVFIACKSKDFGKAVKDVCSVGCIGCGLCANPTIIPNGIITMEGKIPVIHRDRVRESWHELETAVEQCPTHSFGVRIRNESRSVKKQKTEEISS